MRFATFFEDIEFGGGGGGGGGGGEIRLKTLSLKKNLFLFLN